MKKATHCSKQDKEKLPVCHREQDGCHNCARCLLPGAGPGKWDGYRCDHLEQAVLIGTHAPDLLTWNQRREVNPWDTCLKWTKRATRSKRR